ncbi:peptide deformylase [bacterium]|nr:peptide deformylase [bacterium]
MNIIKIGNPILRIKSSNVEDFEFLKLVILEMKELMYKSDGVGLAAPQCGINQNFFLMDPKPNSRYPNADMGSFQVIVNPKIILFSDELEIGFEGCLSVPNVNGRVERFCWLEALYQDENGVFHQKKFSGFEARVFQHEFDHLQGVFYIDRVKNISDLVCF